MRSFSSAIFLGLAALTTLTSAAAVDASCVAEICGAPETAIRTLSSTIAERSLTNGQRLARGLPLKAPTRRKLAVARAEASPAPVVPVEPTTPSAPETYALTGVIRVKRVSDDAVLGTIDTTTTPGGQFKYSTSADKALKVKISLEVGQTAASKAEITMLNSVGPLLGLVQGRDSTNVDIASGSFNYLYLNGVTSPGSSAGSPPMSMDSVYSAAMNIVRAAETSIWTIDLTTGELAPQWINSDESTPETFLFSQGSYIYGGGDVAAFYAKYPSAAIPLVLEFVPDN